MGYIEASRVLRKFSKVLCAKIFRENEYNQIIPHSSSGNLANRSSGVQFVIVLGVTCSLHCAVGKLKKTEYFLLNWASGANLQVNKRTLYWRPFWNKVYPPFRIDSDGSASDELKFDSAHVRFCIWTGPEIVSFAAVIRVVTQRFSPTTTLITAAKETRPEREGSFQAYQSSDTLHVNPSTQERFLYSLHVHQWEISGFTEKLELWSFQN